MSKRLDSELNLRALIYFTAGLVVLLVVTAFLMWGLSGLLRDVASESDAPPSMIPEARMPYLPPEPRLQGDPIGDLRTLRAEEDRHLESYAWVDRGAGLARIPIERAMDLMAAGVESGAPEGTEVPTESLAPAQGHTGGGS